MSGTSSAKFGVYSSSRAASPVSPAGAPPSVCAPSASREGRRTGADARSGLRPAAVGAVSQRAARREPKPSFDSESMVRFLHAAFPQSPAQHLAHLIGCPASTAEKWLRREGAPSAQYLAAMISLFGPAFVAATVRPSPEWAENAARDERRAELIRALDELNH